MSTPVPTNIHDCLPLLLQRWNLAFLSNFNSKVQYNLTEPLEDGVVGIKLTFDSGVPTCEVGTHEDPDLTITMSASNFCKLVVFQYNLLLGLANKTANIEAHKAHSRVHASMLNRAYQRNQ
jgi:hypothetical protein